MSSIHYHKATEQADLFRTMFESFPHGVLITTPDGIIQFSNNAFRNLSGCSEDYVTFKSVDEFFQSRTPESFPVSVIFKEAGTSRIELSDRFMGKGEQQVRVNISITDMSPVVCYTVVPLPHITEVPETYEDLKNLYETLTAKNEELSRANEELIRSNQELSQYAYVASHDLQEPLRKIRIFSDILATNSQLSGKDRFLAGKINKAAERMSVLIRDLLSYSKLIKTEVEFEQVDLQEILKAVLNDFEVSIQEKKAVIAYPDLPVITAVRLQMNQLFFNLVGNAMKFTPPGEAPRIEIDIQNLDAAAAKKQLQHYDPSLSYIKLTFRDHGIGFENKHAETIFKAFERLNTRNAYQGSGIGLALCRRIVQNHRGHLYAHSEPGKGSSFHIILPTTQGSVQKKGPE